MSSNVSSLADTGASVLSLELVPRITRAQSMDVLSSMSTVSGYESVLLAGTSSPQMFPMLMTAAGTVPPTGYWFSVPASPDCRRSPRPSGSVRSSRRTTFARLPPNRSVRSVERRSARLRHRRFRGRRRVRNSPNRGSERQTATSAHPVRRRIRRHHHDGRDPGGAESGLITTDDGRVDAAGFGHRRSGGRARRQLLAHEGRRGGRSPWCRDPRPTDLPSRSQRTASRMLANNIVSLLTYLSDPPARLGRRSTPIVIDPADEIAGPMLVASGGNIVHQGVLDKLKAG